MKNRVNDSGILVIGNRREECTRRIQSEFEEWARIIKLSGARAD